MARPRQYDQALRGALVDAASEAMSRGGPDSLSLRAVAGRAGTTTNAIYVMFGGKDALVEEVLRVGYAGLTASQNAVAMTDDPCEDLVALGKAYRAWAMAHQAIYPALFETEATDDRELGRAALLGPGYRCCSRLVESGRFVDEDLRLIMQSLWASLHGAVSLELRGRFPRTGEDPEAAFDKHLRATISGWTRALGHDDPQGAQHHRPPGARPDA